MTGTIQFTVGTPFKCEWCGKELTGKVRVEGKAQADLSYTPSSSFDPGDFEVDNVEFLDMSLVEFEDLSFEVADEDALYEYLRESNLIDEDIEEEISTEYDYSDWDVDDPMDEEADEEYDRMCDEEYDNMCEEEMFENM